VGRSGSGCCGRLEGDEPGRGTLQGRCAVAENNGMQRRHIFVHP